MEHIHRKGHMIRPINIGNYNKIIAYTKEIPSYFYFSKTKSIVWGSYLYVFETEIDTLKIGRSDDITNRIISHNSNRKLYAGKQLEKIAIFGPFNKEKIKEYESKLIKSIRKSNKFNQIEWGREWFHGKFDELVNLISQLDFEIIAFYPFPNRVVSKPQTSKLDYEPELDDVPF